MTEKRLLLRWYPETQTRELVKQIHEYRELDYSDLLFIQRAIGLIILEMESK